MPPATTTPACILIPGAGGAAGIGAIKALRMAGYRGRIVSTDMDPMSPGLRLADVGHVLPAAAHADFFPRALEMIRRERVEVILPTSGFDTPAYSHHLDELRAAGVVVVGCSAEVMETCQDKWRFHQRVEGRFPVPRTFLTPPSDLEFPCFVKPIRGKGSRGIALCRDRESLERQLAATSGLLIQDYLPGQEYSVDVLGDLAGRPLVAVPRLRLTVNEGISVRGRVVHDPEIEAVCRDLARELGVQGPVCMQLRRDASGRARFMEVNPRMGGGTIFTVLAGVNLPACCLDLAMGRPLPDLAFSEVTVVRYYEEIVLDRV